MKSSDQLGYKVILPLIYHKEIDQVILYAKRKAPIVRCNIAKFLEGYRPCLMRFQRVVRMILWLENLDLIKNAVFHLIPLDGKLFLIK